MNTLRGRMLMTLGLVVAAGCTASSGPAPVSRAPLAPAPPVFIVGQDLGAIRDYLASGCCPAPDALTAYVGLYNLLDPAANFGGLGLDAEGDVVDSEAGWGAGPVNAFKTATEFGIDDLALGLYISENGQPGALDALLAGHYDDEIDQLATFLGRVDGVTYLRIGYEFDGAWNHGLEQPGRFVRAWRYIVERLRARNSGNVRFVWQAGTSVMDELIDGRHEDIRDWYPGDAYVDWLALSWFQHPDARAAVGRNPEHASLRQLADEVLALAREHRKPVMIAESTPQGFDLAAGTKANVSALFDGPTGADRRVVSDDDIWEAWYAPLFRYMEQNRDVIRGFAYINVDWDAQAMWGPPYEPGDSYWGDSRLEANPGLARRFSRAIEAWRRE